jgi:hypothetical protein
MVGARNQRIEVTKRKSKPAAFEKGHPGVLAE